MRAHTLRVGLLVLLLTTGLAQAAENLVINGGFTRDLDGWTAFTGFGVSADWAAVDASGSLVSGSGLGNLPADSSFRQPSPLIQSVNVQPSTSYRFGGRIFIPTGQSTSNRAQLFINSYEAEGCFGNPISGTVVATAYVTTQAQWVQVSDEFTTLANAHCVRINFRFSSPGGEDMTALVDEVFIREFDLPPFVFGSGFE